MKRLAIITKLGETRTGISQKTGEMWEMNDVVVEWEESEPNCQSYKQSLVLSVSGKIDTEKMKSYIEGKIQTSITFYLDVREYNGKYFNGVRGYLPNDLMKK